jgi:hypothetical protein
MQRPSRLCLFALVVGLGTSLRPSAQASAAPQLTPAHHIFLTGKVRMVVNDALKGAIRRLARPSCQLVFTDFDDPVVQPLSNALAVLGKTPEEFLAVLYFVEGDGSNQCRDETTAAFTAPNSRVIHVCGTHFADRFGRNPARGEIILIHELLHALGLGENPPAKAHITDAVLNRCGNVTSPSGPGAAKARAG